MIKCTGSLKFPKFFLNTMTKDQIIAKFNPEQGENREAKESACIKRFAEDIEEDNNLGSIIEIVQKGKVFSVGDGGNRLFNKCIPGDTEFIVFLSIVETASDLVFVINRLNNNRPHSKGYKAYTDEKIFSLINPIANKFGFAGIQLTKEKPSRVTRTVTYLQAARFILAAQTKKADDTTDVAEKISKKELVQFTQHMKIFNAAVDLLDPSRQPHFRGVPALKGWASVMQFTPKRMTAKDILPFLSTNSGVIDEMAGKFPARLQYIFWALISKMAIGKKDTTRERDILKNEVALKQLMEV